jgi:hypothetical protein
MKLHPNYFLLACSVLMLLLFSILPVASFVVVIPLFHINGIIFATIYNAIMFLPIIIALLMIFMSLVNQRNTSLALSIIALVGIVLIGIFMKSIIVNGNLKWLKGSASLLISAINSTNGSSSIADIGQSIDWIASNFMILGIGYYAYAILALVYAVIAVVSPSSEDATVVMSSRRVPQSAAGSDVNPPTIKKDNNSNMGAY